MERWRLDFSIMSSSDTIAFEQGDFFSARSMTEDSPLFFSLNDAVLAALSPFLDALSKDVVSPVGH